MVIKEKDEQPDDAKTDGEVFKPAQRNLVCVRKPLLDLSPVPVDADQAPKNIPQANNDDHGLLGQIVPFVSCAFVIKNFRLLCGG